MVECFVYTETVEGSTPSLFIKKPPGALIFFNFFNIMLRYLFNDQFHQKQYLVFQ
jgi:hypothetical protein